MRRAYRSQLGLAFFGLTPKYRNILFTQIHDLVYHGGGGFKHSEVYNMPIWMGKFHILAINKHVEEVEERQKKQMNKQDLSKQITGPNINPSSVYNLKK